MNILADRARFWVCPQSTHLFTDVVAAVSVADVQPRLTSTDPSHPLAVRVLGSGMHAAELTVQPHPSSVGGRVWWWTCPACERRARCLYARDMALFACRRCSGLRYISETWSSASRLMAHYGRERERWEQQPRRGPKPQRYWSVVAREQRAVREFLGQLGRARRRA